MTDKQRTTEKKNTVAGTVKSISNFFLGDKDSFLLYECPQCNKWLYYQKQNILSRAKGTASVVKNAMDDDSDNVASTAFNFFIGNTFGAVVGLTDTFRGICSQCNYEIFFKAQSTSYNEFRAIIEQHQKAYSKLSDNPSELIDLLRFYSSIRDLPNEIKSEVFDSIVQPDKLEHEYLENFLKIEPEDRRLLVFKDSLDVFPNKGCVVLPLRNRPKGLSFGQQRTPEKNVIYMRHPCKSNVYISAKSFLDEVFEDKLREFKKLLNAWGAEEITIINETVSKEESKESNSIVQKGEGEVDVIPVKIETSKKESEKRSYSIAKKVEIGIRNNPTPNRPPYLPDNLVWYPDEDEWQDNYKSRMERTYSMNYHAYYSEQRSKESVTEEKTSLSVSGLGISQESLKEYEEASVSERDITVNVTFYPMEIYNNKQEKNFFEKLFSK